MNIKGAIFDMDGTLVNSLWCWYELWEWCGKRYLGVDGYRPDEAIDKAVRTMVLSDAMDYIHEKCGFGKDGNELLARFQAILPELYATRIDLKPGVREFLDYCKSNGVKMCLASATDPEYVEIAMHRHGLHPYFESVLSCAVIGKGKEFPDIYEAALESLGTKREETWVFEDSYVALETAVSIGMPTVGIYDEFNLGQDRLEKAATYYVAKGETLMKLV